MSSIAERVQHETRGLRAVERAQLWAYLTMPGFAAEHPGSVLDGSM